MPRLTGVLSVAVMMVWSGHVYAGGCSPASRLVSAGRDSEGYFVRLDWPSAAAGGGVDISPAADYLAAEAGATILYQTRFTDPIHESQTWRGDDPLTTLRAFATSGRLALETSTPSLWVVRPAVLNDYLEVIISAGPADPGHQGLQPVSQIGDIEHALLDQLPVRDTSGYGNRAGIELTYYWLPDEGRDMMLVQYRGADLGGHAQGSSAYKVRLGRSGGRVTVDCLWANGDVSGGLVPEIAEDFDGDGYRDFVFDVGSGPRVLLEAAIISGKDGKTLLKFAGSELAVEKTASGPKRVAAKLFRPDWDEKTPLRSLHLDGTTSRYVEDRPQGASATAVDATGALPGEPRIGVADVLTRRVGGRELVRLYELKSTPPIYAVDETTIARGYPAHILYHYESPGFAAERKRAEEEFRLHPPTPIGVTVTTRRDKPPVPKVWRTPSPTPASHDGTPTPQ